MAPMVRAVLAGIKTHTRRPVKGLALEWLGPDGFTPKFVAAPENHLCPYGVPGDRLWVREHYRVSNKHDKVRPRDIPERSCTVFFEAGGSIANQASGQWEEDRSYSAKDAGDWVGKFRPGMFMCRWMSRILLEVVSVRVERLHDISEADARAEGARECDPVSGREVLLAGPSQRGSYVLHYRDIWETINGPSSWDLNPWVWVVVFKKITPYGDSK